MSAAAHTARQATPPPCRRRGRRSAQRPVAGACACACLCCFRARLHAHGPHALRAECSSPPRRPTHPFILACVCDVLRAFVCVCLSLPRSECLGVSVRALFPAVRVGVRMRISGFACVCFSLCAASAVLGLWTLCVPRLSLPPCCPCLCVHVWERETEREKVAPSLPLFSLSITHSLACVCRRACRSSSRYFNQGGGLQHLDGQHHQHLSLFLSLSGSCLPLFPFLSLSLSLLFLYGRACFSSLSSFRQQHGTQRRSCPPEPLSLSLSFSPSLVCGFSRAR